MNERRDSQRKLFCRMEFSVATCLRCPRPRAASRKPLRVLALTLAIGLGTVPAASTAQPTPRAVTGTVVDTTGRPIENAVVSLDPSGDSRATRADARGRFRLENVSSGRHELRTTWLGYVPDDRTIAMTAAGLDVSITLRPLAFALDTLRILAKRTGILGTAVAHGDFRALGAVSVEVAGYPARTRTASDGRFAFPNVKEGGYLVEGRRNGFRTRLIPVAVPRDDAVEVVLALDSVITKADRLTENLYRDMELRLHGRSVATSAVVPRQELAPRKGTTLDIALRYAPSFLVKGLRFTDGDPCIVVDGRPMPAMRLRDFNADDVAFIEVNTGGVSWAEANVFRAGGGCMGVPTLDSFPIPAAAGGVTGYMVRPHRNYIGTVAFVFIWLKH